VPRKLKIKVLGPFLTSFSNGESPGVTSKKAQALMAYLAVEHGRAHSREFLASLLWGNTGDERARHNLRQALSKIRSCCDQVLISSGDCLSLDESACEIDVVRFESLAPSETAEDLRRCLDLYRGEVLEGLNPREPTYSEWLQLTRTRMRTEACKVASRLGQALFDQGLDEKAIEAYSDLLHIDSAYEPAHRRLMLLMDRCGRRSDALRQYRACEESLQRELGAKPDAETLALFEQLRGAGESSPQPAPVVSAPPAPQPVSTPPAVAVLPFDNLSGPEDIYFADGMAEDLVTALSCFQSLVVIARGSSFAFRDSRLSDKEIAAELGAQYLVRGSVRRWGQRVRINVQLLDAESGVHVWGHRYDREMEDVFALQDEITSTLVSTLAGRVEAARLARARKAPPERLDAHDLLLRGKDHHHRFTPEDCELCIDLFEQAIERDPSYAPAYAWLACGFGQAMVFGLDDLSILVDQSENAAEKGLALDDNDAECHRLIAQVSLERGNLKRALHHQERALRLNPNDDRIVNAMGEMMVLSGDAAEGERWVRQSMRLNPYHPQRYWTHLVRALFHQDKFGEALDTLEHIDKPRTDDLSYRIAALQRLGETQEAVSAWGELNIRFPDFDPKAFVQAMPFRRERDRRALLDPLSEVIRDA
jgi:adenylate cyclase